MNCEERLKRGYVVVFWSRSASESQFIQSELQRAATEIADFNDRVLFALLQDVPLPDFWLRFHEPAVQLYGNAERSTTQRLDDLMVRLYWRSIARQGIEIWTRPSPCRTNCGRRATDQWTLPEM